MSDTIDEKVKDLMTSADSDVIKLALKYLKRNRSNVGNALVESICAKHTPGVALSMDNKTFVCIYVAFEELTKENS
jgi:hypothetical protein